MLLGKVYVLLWNTGNSNCNFCLVKWPFLEQEYVDNSMLVQKKFVL